VVESRAVAEMMIAGEEGRGHLRQQGGEPLLAVDQRPGGDIVAVEMQKIEQVKDKPRRAAGVRCGLQAAEGRNAVGADAAEFAVEIGLTRVERRHGFGDRGIFVRPVEPGAGEQGDRAMVEARMQPVAVEFDFMQPLVAFRRRVDQLRELRRDPLRQSGRA